MNKAHPLVFALCAVAVAGVAWLALSPKPDLPTPRPPDPSEPTPTLAALVTTTPTPTLPTAVPGASGTATPAPLPPYVGPVRDRQLADQLREALTAMVAGQVTAQQEDENGSPAGAPRVPTMPAIEGEGNQADKPLGAYVGRVMQEQFLPLAVSCYEELLARHPKAAGNVVLDFSVMGDDAVGGVVIDASFGDATTLGDAEFRTCTQESMYSVVFDAPPTGHPTLTVSQSFELAP